MELMITAEEAEVLAAALRSYVSDLRMEVVDTDRKRMRDELKHRELVLRTIIDKLEPVAVGGQAWPYEPAPDADSER